jgi:hypothetical protein
MELASGSMTYLWFRSCTGPIFSLERDNVSSPLWFLLLHKTSRSGKTGIDIPVKVFLHGNDVRMPPPHAGRFFPDPKRIIATLRANPGRFVAEVVNREWFVAALTASALTRDRGDRM